jgi:hypothetical protein
MNPCRFDLTRKSQPCRAADPSARPLPGRRPKKRVWLACTWREAGSEQKACRFERSESKFDNYHLFADGTHVASFAWFGCANRAAFDDLPGFRARGPLPLSFPRDETVTEVVNAEGLLVAAYLGRPARLAQPLDSEALYTIRPPLPPYSQNVGD